MRLSIHDGDVTSLHLRGPGLGAIVVALRTEGFPPHVWFDSHPVADVQL
jgi:hypothetical protein